MCSGYSAAVRTDTVDRTSGIHARESSTPLECFQPRSRFLPLHALFIERRRSSEVSSVECGSPIAKLLVLLILIIEYRLLAEEDSERSPIAAQADDILG